MEKYDFHKIEEKWSEHWEKEHYGQAEDFSRKAKHYHLVEFPYPSGAGLHVGHCMGYGASDAYCRMKRMQGYNVMYPIGWDAFGLPTENYALRTGIHPTVATAQNIAIFKRQIKQLGYAFDWSREINTTDPDYYRWTQWIFLQFYKHSYKGDSPNSGTVPGSRSKERSPLIKVADDDATTPRLAYQKEMPINWCPACKIGLANEEVISGACERCGAQAEKRMQKQWLLRITAYADRLIRDLDTVDYLDKIKTQQINWIGRSEGARVHFMLKAEGRKLADELEVFTTRVDTLFGATFMVIAPEHPLIQNIRYQISNIKEVEGYIDRASRKSDLERTELAKEKTGIEILGIKAVNPINDAEIPVFIADYVLPNYGTGAVMAVPAHDERDWEFAQKYHLPIKTVVVPASRKQKNQNEELNQAYIDYGVLVNSGPFDSLTSGEAKKKIAERLKSIGAGDFAVNYKLRDWIFSRQHYWGEPIPIIHCKKCGIVPVPEDQLPLRLPDIEKYEPTETGKSPLAKVTDWVNTICPRCDGPAKRETDTMPNWAGSSWYYLRYCDPNFNPHPDPLPNREREPKGNIKDDLFETPSPLRGEGGGEGQVLASRDKLDYWLPVDIYDGGMEHTTLHLLYSRFWHKFLYDLDQVPTAEPYAKRIAHGIILGPDGQKMSKSRGNVINPDEMIKKFGADTLRAYIMFIGPYDQESAWSMAGIQGVFRFMNRVWHNSNKVTGGQSPKGDSPQVLVKLHQTIAGATDDLTNFRLNTVVSKLMEFNNLLEKQAAISAESFGLFLRLLFPIAPHLAAELWEQTQTQKDISAQPWPQVDQELLAEQKITIVIQVDGKYRDGIQTSPDISEEEMKQAALSSQKARVSLGTKRIRRIVVVPKKLINIVT
ncbi:MAG: leucine--tRNA ligase [Patescibacteria group bacterium]